MSDEAGFLPPGPLQVGSLEIQVVGPMGRVGDGLVYLARHGFQPIRLREYCPVGIVRRAEDGSLVPADPSFAPVWSDAVQRFLAQAEQLAAFPPGAPIQPVLAAAPHPAGAEHGAFLVTPPVGQTLEAALAHGLKRSPVELVRFSQQLAEALALVHGRGLTHLDIWQATVSLGHDAVQLSDFSVDNRAFMPLLQSDTGLLRPGYAAFERYSGSQTEPLGPPTDIYAASALIYRLIVGEAPRPSPERFRNPALPKLEGRTEYPADFIDAVRRGLAVEPEQRFVDGSEWLAALGGSAAPAGSSAATLEPSPPAYPPIPRGGPLPPFEPPEAAPRRRTPWLVPLILLLVLVAGALAFAFSQGWFNGSNEREEAPAPAPVSVRPRPFALPGSVSDTLGPGDRRWESGRYEDVYSVEGYAAQELELRFATSAFVPRVTVTGPGGFATALQVRRGRSDLFSVILPIRGTYNVAVTSEGAGEGPYTLAIRESLNTLAIREPPAPAPSEPVAPEPVVPKPVPEDPAPGQPPTDDPEPPVEEPPAPNRTITGTWRGPGDPGCRQPARNSLPGAPRVGSRFTSTVSGTTFVHEVVRVDGRRIETVLRNTRLAGRRFVFELSEGGDRYSIEGETWTRC
jgi:hypothetical protein